MRSLPIATGIFLVACSAGIGRGQNWSQFRGAGGDGIAKGAELPTQWGMEKNLAWKAKLPGVGWSQPVVWGDKIFVTTAVAEKQQRPKPGDWSPGDGLGGLSLIVGSLRRPPNVEYRWEVLCLEASTGKVLWEQAARTGKPTIPIHPNNSYATETPATDGQRVIASFGPAGLYCYDLSGQLAWSKDLGSYPTQMDWGTASSPVLEGGRVFVQCDNDKASFLVALDKQTGAELWRAERGERTNWSTPYIWRNDKRTELIVAGGSRMRSYDPATGQMLWEMAASGRSSASPVADEKLLFVDSGDRLTGQRGLFAALRPGAEGDISLPDRESASAYVAWSAMLSGGRVASPLVVEHCLYLLEQQSGILRCLDAASGKQHYRQRLPGAAAFTASPWASGDKVYCLDQSGQTFVLQGGPTLKVLATNKLDDEMFWSSAAVAGDAHLIRGLDYLFCIRK